MCFATSKIPHGTQVHRDLVGPQKAEEQLQMRQVTEEVAKATRNPLSMGKNRPRAKSNINPNI